MNKSGIAGQVISHPQGGGAVEGLGEAFRAESAHRDGKPDGADRDSSRPQQVPARSVAGVQHGPRQRAVRPGMDLKPVQGSRATPATVFRSYADGDDAFLLSGAERLVATRRVRGRSAALPAANRRSLRTHRTPPVRARRLLGGAKPERSEEPVRELRATRANGSGHGSRSGRSAAGVRCGV